MVPGNHEFDWGTENLLALEKEADFPIICANIFRPGDNDTLFNTQFIFETKLGKIGFFGLTTPETATRAQLAKVFVSYSALERLITQNPDAA